MTPINVPKLGLSMTEAVLASWAVDDGAAVDAGDVICTIETDKVEQEIEAPVGWNPGAEGDGRGDLPGR